MSEYENMLPDDFSCVIEDEGNKIDRFYTDNISRESFVRILSEEEIEKYIKTNTEIK